MKRLVGALAVLVLGAAAWATPGPDGTTPPAGQQAGGEAPTPGAPKDAEAAQYLKDLKPQIGKQADAEAKASIKKLVAIWKDKDVTAATKKPVPDLLEAYARLDKQTLIAVDAIDALGDLGPEEGAGPVLSLLDRALKAKDPPVDIYGSCLRSLKKLADPRKATVGKLIDLLRNKADDVVAKAADAMGGYKDSPGKVRKELIEELIKNTEGTFSQSKDPKNATQVSKWRIIQFSVLGSLKALSGQDFKDPEEARRWFNEHKKDKSWDN
jgi:hypothetical protein